MIQPNVAVAQASTKIIAMLFTGVEHAAEAALPGWADELLKVALDNSWTQGWLRDLEAQGGQKVAEGVALGEDALMEEIRKMALAHPLLGKVLATVEPIAPKVAAFAADEVKAFIKLRQGGRWDEVRKFLADAGVM